MQHPLASTFVPHPLFRGGHAQTLAGAYLWRRLPHRAQAHHVDLPDGDQLVVHDDQPASWEDGQRVVLLLHGLAGCHGSGYMMRIASKLVQRGYRAFRLDQRGCGAGMQLARQTFHAGRSEDVVSVIHFLRQLCLGSRVTVAGFSLGGAILLKMLTELGPTTIGGLDSAVAVAPPIDLMRCSQNIGLGWNRIYDRSFVRRLMRYVRSRQADDPILESARQRLRPRSLYEFDAQFTAPMGGFADVTDYYARCSTVDRLHQISLPTRILTAADDPLLPVETFHEAQYSDSVQLTITDHGGHLGFVGIREASQDADWHWMDWRVVDWVQQFDQLQSH